MILRRSRGVFFYFIAMCRNIRFVLGLMNKDNDLKVTLQQAVTNAILRMESSSEAKTRRCIFQEYKEWLGTSIDDWVLALPNDWGKSDANFY